MKTTLTKIITQVDRRGFDQSEMLIKVEVNINRQERTAELSQLISVMVYNVEKKVYTDVTNIMFEHFDEQIEKIDWWEVWENTKKYAA